MNLFFFFDDGYHWLCAIPIYSHASECAIIHAFDDAFPVFSTENKTTLQPNVVSKSMPAVLLHFVVLFPLH